MTKLKRDKRLFGLAEHLAAELNKSRGDVQPEDIVGFMHWIVPMTEEDAENDEQEFAIQAARQPGRGAVALAKLRKSLGFSTEDSLISVIEKAAEVCENNKLKAAIDEPSTEFMLPNGWRVNEGGIFCGTLRIAVFDFDTDPSDDVKSRVYRQMAMLLNGLGEQDLANDISYPY